MHGAKDGHARLSTTLPMLVPHHAWCFGALVLWWCFVAKALGGGVPKVNSRAWQLISKVEIAFKGAVE
jgi:hypothetical protein